MPAPEDAQHSTLEVDFTQDGRAAPIVGQSPNEEKIIRYKDDGKQAADISGMEALPATPLPAYADKPHPPLPTQGCRILGLRRKAFSVVLAVTCIVVLAAAIGGGVGGGIAARNRKPRPTAATAPSPTIVPYTNTGLAAMQWTDLNGILHKRLYYQDNSNKVRESAWDNSTGLDTPWQINTISDAIKPISPIAATAGYPHASFNYSLVRTPKFRVLLRYWPTYIKTGQERVLHLAQRRNHRASSTFERFPSLGE